MDMIIRRTDLRCFVSAHTCACMYIHAHTHTHTEGDMLMHIIEIILLNFYHTDRLFNIKY